MMHKTWKDPVKSSSARAETLAIEGDFAKFAELMKRVVRKPKAEKRATSASPAPVAS